MSKLEDLKETEAHLEELAASGNTIAGSLAGQLLKIIGAVTEVAAGAGSPDLDALMARVDALEAKPIDWSLAPKYDDAILQTVVKSAAESVLALGSRMQAIEQRVAMIENAFAAGSAPKTV